MAPKPITYKSMTAVDNERYVQMISRLHDLGSFAEHYYRVGEIDRATFSGEVAARVDSALKGLMGFFGIQCKPGECPCHGLCVDCGPEMFDERALEMTQESFAQLIDEIGLEEVNARLRENLRSS